MLKKWFVLFLVLMFGTAAAVSAEGSTAGGDDPPQPVITKHVKESEAVKLHSQIGIWYTVWWDDKEPYASHWKDWTRYSPVLGDYAADDEEIIRTHMNWLKQAGIDFVILDDTNGHYNDGGNIAEHIDKIFQVVAGMPEGTAPKLTLAIGAGQWAAHSAEAHQEEADLIYDRYVPSPAFYYWKGKPLLIDYTTSSWYYKWNDDRFTVRWATGKVSEGANVAPDTGLWGWVIDQIVPSTEEVGVMPGWSRQHLDGRTPILRENGKLYTDMWLDAVKADPQVIVIPSFNDFAEETAIEAAVPRSAGTEPWAVDYYGDPTPDWYQQITQGYSGLKSGLLDGFYYKEEDKDAVYMYQAGELIRTAELPHKHPVIVLPKGYFSGNYKKDQDPGQNQGEDNADHVVLDVFQNWVDNFKTNGTNWSYGNILDNGETTDHLVNGSVFYDIIKDELNDMLKQIPDEQQRIVRKGFKVHPAWQNTMGWTFGKAQLNLPDPEEKKLYLTYYPGKVNKSSDGITLTVYVNGEQVGYQWVTGESGWKDKVVIDLSAYAGQSIELSFKVGWGKEELGDKATTGNDSFLIGDPLIVTNPEQR